MGTILCQLGSRQNTAVKGRYKIKKAELYRFSTHSNGLMSLACKPAEEKTDDGILAPLESRKTGTGARALRGALNPRSLYYKKALPQEVGCIGDLAVGRISLT